MHDHPDFVRLGQLKSRLDSYRPLSTEIVQNLHDDMVLRWTNHSNAIEGNTLIPRNIDDRNAGNYRSVNVLISGTRHRPPQHFKQVEEMERFFAWYCGVAPSFHPEMRAARVHAELVRIHPFRG